MGVKSTRILTRAEAEALFVSLWAKTNEQIIRAEATALTNTELEDLLEQMDDEQAGGESFNNYRIGTNSY